MRVLTISSVFPPRVIGGAELSAFYLAKWLSQKGVTVGVLTISSKDEPEIRGETANGLQMYRLHWPRTHTQHEHKAQSRSKKLLWHIQDHADPRNSKLVRSIVSEFRPDIINVHVAQGIGHNALHCLHDYPGIRVFYFLHDLVLACIRTTMFFNGKNCESMCFPCNLSSRLKMRELQGLDVQFVSPSKANLETLKAILNLRDSCCHVIPNLDLSPATIRRQVLNSCLRFIFVGRLAETKGIDMLLDILQELHNEGHLFEIKVIGDGPLRLLLQDKLKQEEWVHFTGHIPGKEVDSHMSQSDILLCPSIWREVLGNVVRQALRSGVPALVSDLGGPKEMVEDGINGMVLKAGDKDEWKKALGKLLSDPSLVSRLQQSALMSRRRYDADALGKQILELFRTPKRTEAV